MKKEIIGGVSVLVLAVGVVAYSMLHTNTAAKPLQSAQMTQPSQNETIAQAPNTPPAEGLKVGNGQGLGDIVPTSGDNLSNGAQVQTNNTQKEDFSQYDQYKAGKEGMFGDIKVGTGAEVGVNKKVAIYYKGYLTNGQVFDESKPEQANGPLQPFVFTEGKHEVISGMEQAIFGMKVGGKRRLVIPPAVGYGDQGQGTIPPNSVLVFDVDLLSVQ
jgi:FKBP-type peptidyl-prolyl cis-trans isomerase FkpA